MNITITPYKLHSKFPIIITIVTSVIMLIIGYVSNDNYISIFLFPFIFLIWIMPLSSFLIYILHNKRSVTINDEEIICKNIARVNTSEFVVGGFIDLVNIKRDNIAKIYNKFQFVFLNPAASKGNLVIYTNKKQSFILDGRLIDTEAVQLAINNKTEETLKRIEKKSKQTRLSGIICTTVVDVLFVILLWMFAL